MLSVPTLWVVFVVNFVAIGVVWIYVVRSYPNFNAARFWMAAAFAAAAGAAISMTRGFIDPQAHTLLLIPLLAGGTTLILASCLAMMGVERFYGRPVSWRASLLIAGLTCAGLTFFIWHDNMPMRILIYSLGQALPIVLTLAAIAIGLFLLFSPVTVPVSAYLLWRLANSQAPPPMQSP